MTITEHLRSLPDEELVKYFDDFNMDDESGWQSVTVAITPYGSLTKTLIAREIDRRMKGGDAMTTFM